MITILLKYIPSLDVLVGTALQSLPLVGLTVKARAWFDLILFSLQAKLTFQDQSSYISMQQAIRES